MALFEYNAYRPYLEFRLSTKEYGRGGKSALAQHLSCQSSFVSQVLKEKSSFNLEQGFKINSFLKHNKLEADYFLVLIQLDRAGTTELKKYFESQRLDLIEKSKNIASQINYDRVPDSDIIKYYNNWSHVLIRNLVFIPDFQTEEGLKQKTGLTPKQFASSIEFLLKAGLIVKKDDKYLPGHKKMHIEKDSPLAHYANITARLQAIQNYQKLKYNSFNFGAYIMLTKKNYEMIRSKLTQLIAELHNELTVEDLVPEVMSTLVIDFMEI